MASCAPELPPPCVSQRGPPPTPTTAWSRASHPPEGGGVSRSSCPPPERPGRGQGRENPRAGSRGWERGHPQGGPRAGIDPTQVGQKLGGWTEGRPQAAGLLDGGRGAGGVCRIREEPGATAAPLSPGR